MTAEMRTNRLRLRLVNDDDLPDLVRGLSDWRVARNISRIPFPYSESDARAYFPDMQRRALEDTGYCWTINDGKFCGIVAVDFEASQGELGYWLVLDSGAKGMQRKRLALQSISPFGVRPVLGWLRDMLLIIPPQDVC